VAESLVAGLSPDGGRALLAGLHDRLHALAWPGAAPGEALLHLDLHPLNVILRGSGPVVID
jgi:Ser/Thr protein kinase RdoA (MazF antagonist)